MANLSTARTWWRVAVGIKEQNSRDNLTIVAAGVAFYAFLAIFPGVVALVSIYGLITDPSDIQALIEQLGRIAPGGAISIIESQLNEVAGSASSALGVGVMLGILVALWSANKGTKALIQAIEIVYEQKDERGFFKLNGLSLLITFAATFGVIIALIFVAVVPIALKILPFSSVWIILMNWLRWPFIAAIVAGGVALFYRYAPGYPIKDWKILWSGAVVATVLWLLVSALFSWYVASFGSYNETYGSLATVVILLLWFFLSSYAVLLGAEVNYLLWRQYRESMDA